MIQSNRFAVKMLHDPKEWYCTNEHVQVCSTLAGKGAQARQALSSDPSSATTRGYIWSRCQIDLNSSTSSNQTKRNLVNSEPYSIKILMYLHCRHRTYWDVIIAILIIQPYSITLSARTENHRLSMIVICTTKSVLFKSSCALLPLEAWHVEVPSMLC